MNPFQHNKMMHLTPSHATEIRMEPVIDLQQQQQQRLIPLGGVGYMDQLPP